MNSNKILSIALIMSCALTSFAAQKTEEESKRAASQKQTKADPKERELLETVAQLLVLPPATIHECFQKHMIPEAVYNTALLQAAKTGTAPETVRVLLEERANPEFTLDGLHPLLAAAQSGDPKTIQHLLDTRDLEATLVGQVVVQLTSNSQQPAGATKITELLRAYPGKQTDLLAQRVDDLATKEKGLDDSDLIDFGKFITDVSQLVIIRFLPTLEEQIRSAPSNSQKKKNLEEIKKTLMSFKVLFDLPVDTRRLLSTQSSDDPVYVDELGSPSSGSGSSAAGV